MDVAYLASRCCRALMPLDLPDWRALKYLYLGATKLGQLSLWSIHPSLPIWYNVVVYCVSPVSGWRRSCPALSLISVCFLPSYPARGRVGLWSLPKVVVWCVGPSSASLIVFACFSVLSFLSSYLFNCLPVLARCMPRELVRDFSST